LDEAVKEVNNGWDGTASVRYRDPACENARQQHVQSVKAQRRTNKECELCGKSLGILDRAFELRSHSVCGTFAD
jgi:PHP family Zn ribbon phosphoesterase